MTTRTVNLLSEEGQRRLLGPEGLDAAMTEAEAARLAGPFLPDDSEGPFPVLVRCSANLHDIPVGTDCPECERRNG